MAYLNNIYGNASYVGFLQGMLQGRLVLKSATAADYNTLRAAALAMATDLDASIAADPLVTSVGQAPEQLNPSAVLQAAIAAVVATPGDGGQAIITAVAALTTGNIIAADCQWRAGILQACCSAAAQGLYTRDATAAGAGVRQAQAVAAAKAAWTSCVAGLVSP